MSLSCLWDSRLTQRGVAVGSPLGAIAAVPGRLYWRVVRGQWFDERASGGRHHIYVETRDERGQPLADVPFRVAWPSGAAVQLTNGDSDFDPGNFPMSPSRNGFAVTIADGIPSERVTGIGMGVDTPHPEGPRYNPGLHTATLLVFQRAASGTGFAGSEPPPPVDPPTADLILDALYDARSAVDAAIERYLGRSAA